MSLLKVLDIAKPFRNGCGYRNGRLEDVEEFMQCAITLASLVNPQLAIAKYGMILINASKELQDTVEEVQDLMEVIESGRKSAGRK